MSYFQSKNERGDFPFGRRDYGTLDLASHKKTPTERKKEEKKEKKNSCAYFMRLLEIEEKLSKRLLGLPVL